MTYPNTLIFIDFASDDPEASATFYGEVFGWEIEPRPGGVFHRIVPGSNFQLDDGAEGPTGNLHMGISNVANRRPHPDPRNGTVNLQRGGGGPRIWILISDDDDADAILERAVARGAKELWRHHYWEEFNGFSNAFEDPWGTEIVTWTKAGDDPQIPEGWTGE
jgi:predicted enzyme related to lactoylglutathione lyase